jgi:hypothetical protein
LVFFESVMQFKNKSIFVAFLCALFNSADAFASQLSSDSVFDYLVRKLIVWIPVFLIVIVVSISIRVIKGTYIFKNWNLKKTMIEDACCAGVKAAYEEIPRENNPYPFSGGEQELAIAWLKGYEGSELKRNKALANRFGYEGHLACKNGKLKSDNPYEKLESENFNEKYAAYWRQGFSMAEKKR